MSAPLLFVRYQFCEALRAPSKAQTIKPPSPTSSPLLAPHHSETPGHCKMSVNLRTVYAFAREMYPKNVTADIQYGTAGFRTRYKHLHGLSTHTLHCVVCRGVTPPAEVVGRLVLITPVCAHCGVACVNTFTVCVCVCARGVNDKCDIIIECDEKSESDTRMLRIYKAWQFLVLYHGCCLYKAYVCV